MAYKGRRVTVTDEATPLNSTPSSTGKPGSAALVKNPSGGTVTVDVGGADVVSGDGYELKPGDGALSLPLEGLEDAFAIAPAGESVELQVLEQGI